MRESKPAANGTAGNRAIRAMARGIVRLDKWFIDFPELLAPVAVVLGLLLLIRAGIGLGIWGEPIRAQEESEAATARALLEVERAISLHNAARPSILTSRHWADESTTWHERDDGLQIRRKTLVAMLPSRLSLQPNAPTIELNAVWTMYRNLDHLISRFVGTHAAAIVLLVALPFAWRQSDRRRDTRTRDAIRRHSPDAPIIGCDASGAGHYLPEADRAQHLLIVGASGSGKSQTLKHLAQVDIEAGRAVVFIDLKGDREFKNAIQNACVRARRGQDFRWFSLDDENSHSYDPLASGSAIAKRDRILAACEWSGEKFYENFSRALLGRLLVAFERGRGAITFDDLYLAASDRDTMVLVAEWAAPEDAARFARDLEDWPTLEKHASGLVDNLSEFASGELRPRLCSSAPQILLEQGHRENLVVYFEINTQMRSKAGPALARILFEDLKCLAGKLASEPHRRKPLHVYIDEAGCASYRGLADLISQCRSAGIALTLATQAADNFILKDQDPAVRTAVLQNTATKLILRQADPTSAQLGADIGGTTRQIARTTQTIDQGLLLGIAQSGVYSEREVREYVAHPDTLKQLRVGGALFVKCNGERVVIQIASLGGPEAGTPARPVRPITTERAMLNLRGLVEERRAQRAKRGPKLRKRPKGPANVARSSDDTQPNARLAAAANADKERTR